ncbi:MAG: TlpA disulfide reductase family protein [Pseudomonadales bacterium]|nr:TlpA disulfide reductase family protein [Pseudomonadales bacterium]
MPERILRMIAICMLSALGACAEPPPSAPPADASAAAAPEATGPSIAFLDGSTRSLASLQGRWVFVNYWAEWCGPCLEEIPELNAFHEERSDAFVMGINFDRLPAEEMRPQVASLGIRFPVAEDDPAALLGITAPEVLPSTYVFDPSGQLVTTLVGPQDHETLLAAMAAAP